MFRRLFLALFALTVMCGNALAADTFRVVSNCTWPPMEFMDENKNPIGFDIDYIRAVGKAAGFDVEIQHVAWDGILGGVATGKYDIVAAAVTITEERKKAFDFSDAYYEVTQTVVLPKGKTIKSMADLKGKRVGGQIGTTGIFVMRKVNVGAELKEYDDVGLAMADLLGGRLDAVICDSPVALYYCNVKPDSKEKLDLSIEADEKEYYGFVVKKGRQDLVDRLNKGIKLVRESGEEARLLDKWLGKK